MDAGQKPSDWEFFIAHAGADAPAAERIYDLLSPHARVFLDTKSLNLGDAWDDALPRAQKASLITVVLISPRTEKAWYQRDEIAAAVDLARKSGQRVVPVYVGGANMDENVPYGLQRLQAARITSEDDWRRLAEGLLKLVKIQAPIPGPGSGAAPAPALRADYPDGVPVFLLAAHADKDAVDVLRKHLYLAKKEKLVRLWSPADLALSTMTAEEVRREFDRAALILIFVSAELYPAWDDEDTVPKEGTPGKPMLLLEEAVRRFHQGSARVVPILLGKVVLSGSKLAELVALPRERGAVSEWRDRDAAWAHIAKEVRALAQSIKSPGKPAA